MTTNDQTLNAHSTFKMDLGFGMFFVVGGRLAIALGMIQRTAMRNKKKKKTHLNNWEMRKWLFQFDFPLEFISKLKWIMYG